METEAHLHRPICGEEEVAELDRLMDRRGGEGRRAALATTFRQATRLEAAFWQMGLAFADRGD